MADPLKYVVMKRNGIFNLSHILNISGGGLGAFVYYVGDATWLVEIPGFIRTDKASNLLRFVNAFLVLWFY